ncbi:MAG: hypothetical protein IPO63_05095 [Bacteroidetes bacterium]|nr:hypothetical protein [Bacteroidota bacterium]
MNTSLIPLKEVNVEAEAIRTSFNVQEVNSTEKVKEGTLQVNARHTFNVLIEFIISKSMEIVRHFVPTNTENKT